MRHMLAHSLTTVAREQVNSQRPAELPLLVESYGGKVPKLQVINGIPTERRRSLIARAFAKK